MKSNIKYIRKIACDILLQYRATYNLYRSWEIISDDQLEYMYNCYIMLRGLYYCGLISAAVIDKAYYMYVEIKKIKIRHERGDNNGNRI